MKKYINVFEEEAGYEIFSCPKKAAEDAEQWPKSYTHTLVVTDEVDLRHLFSDDYQDRVARSTHVDAQIEEMKDAN